MTLNRSSATATPVTHAPEAVTQQAVAAPALGAALRRSSAGMITLGVLGVVGGGVAVLVITAVLLEGLGPGLVFIGGLLALVPLAIVFFVVRWIDRWEPEPRLAVAFAFLWGAGVSVLAALIVGAEFDSLLAAMAGSAEQHQFLSAAVQAPIVEELGKGIGLLLIFFVARKHFDGPVDGLVYAAWVAGGFAFTENILYFGAEIVETGNPLAIFIVRGLMSPFAHVMFTACMGVALGFASHRASVLATIGLFLVGLVGAVLLHALWNGALFFVTDFFGYYAIVQFPLFLGAVFIEFRLRREEAKLTHARLTEYAVAGWFNPQEIDALATPAGRRQAMAWARSNGRGSQMKRYLHDATRLAFARQRIIIGRDRIGAQHDEAMLLDAVVNSRRALTA